MGVSRRQFVGAGAAAGIIAARRSFAGTRTNILIITTDQQFGDSMSCRIGERYLRTPHRNSSP